MRTQCLESLADIAPGLWNSLVRDRYPFLRHEFLLALERHGCVGPATGWLPRHLVCFDDRGRLLGAAPLYLKDNSYGEFVFDWGWADAYQHHRLRYYPKLVSAIPFTPATGQRLLLSSPADPGAAAALIEHALEEVQRQRLSSLHWLFPTAADMASLQAQGLLRRLGCQFHWRNRGYRDFDDFLDSLTAKRRKNIKRERRLVEEAGLVVRTLQGTEVSESEWRAFYDFYRSTFHRRGGIPTLTLGFFQEIAATMGDQVLLVLAQRGRHPVAGAISFRSDHTLYGRHWGCTAEYDSLHFEACYYQGIIYCIHYQLATFEPGAQGEYKVHRGFLPTLTESAHWIAHPGFRQAIAEFLHHETPAVQAYAEEWRRHSPFREEYA
jgi:predicted N-acyltransferase